MIMTPAVRRFALTTHVSASVAWIGAAFVFLVHALLGLTSDNPNVVRGVYLVMEPAAWFALVPLATAALVTGIVQALGTTWGLFRHYWVVFKLLITAFATIILLIYMATFRQMAAAASNQALETSAVRNASPALHAALAVAVLLIATVLGFYKPRGLTPYGRRMHADIGATAAIESAAARGIHAVAVIAVVLMFAMIATHLVGGHGSIQH